MFRTSLRGSRTFRLMLTTPSVRSFQADTPPTLWSRDLSQRAKCRSQDPPRAISLPTSLLGWPPFLLGTQKPPIVATSRCGRATQNSRAFRGNASRCHRSGGCLSLPEISRTSELRSELITVGDCPSDGGRLTANGKSERTSTRRQFSWADRRRVSMRYLRRPNCGRGVFNRLISSESTSYSRVNRGRTPANPRANAEGPLPR